MPPQHIEAEKALLGSIMMRPEAIYDCLDVIKPESFYVEKHRIIYNAMLDLHTKREPIDLVSLAARLSEKKQIESIGGRSYLAELASTVASSSNARHYAELVQKKHILRTMIAVADTVAELGYDEERDVDELIDDAEKTVLGIANLVATQKYSHIKDELNEAWERLDTLHNGGEGMRGVPTGFEGLDTLLSGLQKSDLIILAARPSMGKTSLALDIARQVATMHSVPTLVFSLEMSSQQLVDRMLAAESRVDSWKLRTGQLNVAEEFTKIRDALDRLSKAPIYIDDQAANTLMRMRSIGRRLKREHNIGLIIIDYLQLIHPSRHYDNMVMQITEISKGLKQLARELDVPVLALSQLSRAVEQRRDKPRLSDLRDSGSIEQDADVVLFIHRDDRYNENSERPNVAEILIEKHRNGPIGKVELYFDEKKTTFLSLSKDTFGDTVPVPKKQTGIVGGIDF